MAAAVHAWADTFYGFQQGWLLDLRRFAALNKCRQIGGSHTFGAWAVLRGVWGEDCVLVSRAEPEAIELLGVARKHAEVLTELGCDWARVVSPPNALKFVMASGAEIRATTSKSAGRGFSGNVVLDEFAYHEHPENVWDAALAVTTHGFSARVLSTPNGVGNLFHQLITELGSPNPKSDKEWKTYLTTIDDAIADGMDIDLEFCWSMARNDPRVFDQLFRGVFLDGNLQYLPTELLARAAVQELPRYGTCFGGIDIGESQDKTSLVVIQGEGGVFSVKHVETHPRMDDLLLAKVIGEAFSLHKCTRVAIDATGLGSFPAKAAVRKHGMNLEPIHFTGPIKEAMATRLYQAMVDGKLKLPLTGREANELRDDLCSIRRIVTAAGNVRFDAARNSRGHADRAWALMLALQCSEHGDARSAYSRLRGLRA
jgi:phage FluMu gp28-like protein